MNGKRKAMRGGKMIAGECVGVGWQVGLEKQKLFLRHTIELDFYLVCLMLLKYIPFKNLMFMETYLTYTLILIIKKY